MSNIRRIPMPVGALTTQLLLQTITSREPLTEQARTAGYDELEHTREQFALLTDLYQSAVKELIDKLNENLSIGQTIDQHEFRVYMHEARASIVGLIVQQMERGL